METELHEKLIKARIRRGWSVREAARRSDIVHQQTLANLEYKSTEAVNCRLIVALTLVELYWPDLSLDDFAMIRTRFRLVPKSKKDDEIMRYS